MTKKTWLLIFVALALAAAYVINYTNWFTPKVIHIICTNERSSRIRRDRNLNAGSTTVPVIFKLGRPYKLTDIKVVALDEWQTNKDCLPLWHLIGDADSDPIDEPFTYGGKIDGMDSAVEGAQAEPLQPGVKYRFFVTDGSAKGELDFTPVAKPPAASP
jgi:hypothetical protein